jgi:hypothetical protein
MEFQAQSADIFSLFADAESKQSIATSRRTMPVFAWSGIAVAGGVVTLLVLVGFYWPFLKPSSLIVTDADPSLNTQRHGKLISLAVGDSIEAGDLLTSSTSEIRLFDQNTHTELQLSPRSKVLVNATATSDSSKFELLAGKLNVEVNESSPAKYVSLHTSHGEAFVQGSRCEMQMLGERTLVRVEHGKVGIKRKGSEFSEFLGPFQQVELDGHEDQLAIQAIPLEERLRMNLELHLPLNSRLDSANVEHPIGGVDVANTVVTYSSGIDREGVAFHAGRGNEVIATNLNQAFSEYTIAGWVRISPESHRVHTLAATSASGVNRRGVRWMVNEFKENARPVEVTKTGCLVLEASNGAIVSKVRSLPKVIQPGRWHHVAFVLSNMIGEVNFYVDGNDVTLQNQIPKDASGDSPWHFGAMPGKYPNRLAGCLDELRFYSRRLSAEEIEFLAKQFVAITD